MIPEITNMFKKSYFLYGINLENFGYNYYDEYWNYAYSSPNSTISHYIDNGYVERINGDYSMYWRNLRLTDKFIEEVVNV